VIIFSRVEFNIAGSFQRFKEFVGVYLKSNLFNILERFFLYQIFKDSPLHVFDVKFEIVNDSLQKKSFDINQSM